MVTFLLGLILIVVLVNLYIASKCIGYKKDIYELTDMNTYYRNKLSMIECQYRKYSEGENAFTVLRKLGNLIQQTDFVEKQEFKG